ncbi:MAG: hypothetical protein KA314_24490 [Chloroflexi bacterium]|nr:hypothetical protein [Chloroflexota bacterium]MBP8059005.1 hypothetical protein [Chloroflexota bacterium]
MENAGLPHRRGRVPVQRLGYSRWRTSRVGLQGSAQGGVVVAAIAQVYQPRRPIRHVQQGLRQRDRHRARQHRPVAIIHHLPGCVSFRIC